MNHLSPRYGRMGLVIGLMASQTLIVLSLMMGTSPSFWAVISLVLVELAGYGLFILAAKNGNGGNNHE